ncbi:DNA mismatch repair protein [Flavobacterium sp.]|uniref:MutS-related protein n=1 Tax=Flavobacterium sp. TaxID=239 RepID=UPI002611E51F|nr:DNA mismatch repair protein [Flavobacterium sp.]MDG2431310.1 DNA mismatch repair protein [Flavobacterium sp.]
MKVYQDKITQFTLALQSINKKYNSISLVRLLVIVAFFVSVYYYVEQQSMLFIVLAIALFVGFIFLMKLHSKLLNDKKIANALLTINKDELAFVSKRELPFEDGQEFIDFQHPYAYDLDIFGAHSLFQNLNRTATFIGKKTLAERLLVLAPNEEIIENQAAVAELSSKLDWRQDFLAFAKVSQDNQSSYESLLRWSTFNSNPLSRLTNIGSYILPLLFIGSAIGYLISSNTIFVSAMSYLFIINLAFLGKYFKRIQIEISNSDNIDKILKQYSKLLQKVEEEKFSAPKLLALQQKLKFKEKNASAHFQELSELFSKMDSINNLITATLFNGAFLYNLHALKDLLKWKKEHATALEDWLAVIGEFEMLNSFANLSYNNPDFVFPTLNTDFKISFNNLSHPLLTSATRVGNEVQFYPQSFMILTGSNMSGKSTFLRSLGINMVLAGAGSVVCAAAATVHPLPVLVSMRLSDSLSDSESYFFAEIKRLKQIMNALEKQPAFVLLDEILRGTNSDDKRNGTIEVVKKVIANKAIGAIATHDIEVCLTTNAFPAILTNKCFEVEIVNDELHFDYKLRDGICKNKSATFLMTKMGVI